MPALGEEPSQLIVFDSRHIQRGVTDVYVVQPDGTGLKRVTSAGKGKPLAFARLPSLSSNQRRIVFEGGDAKGESDIYIANADGKNLKRLHCQLRPARSYQAVWSPDDKAILFRAKLPQGKGSALFVMDSDGKNLRQVGPMGSYWGSWSPDGKRIAFSSIPEAWKQGDPIDLFIMNADGTSIRRLTNKQGQNQAADWSPDGRTIVFNSKRDGNGEIYSLDVESGQAQNLTKHEKEDFRPAFSPDGKRIVFTSMRGPACLYVMDADGRNVRPLRDAVGNHADW